MPPAPDRVVTAAPTVEPVTGAAAKVHEVAPLAVRATATPSRIPSPFGEIREPPIEAPVTTGATRSIVTP